MYELHALIQPRRVISTHRPKFGSIVRPWFARLTTADSIDPVIMAAALTLRLQTIVSRQLSPLDSAVLTIGSLQAGTKENIIPDDATLKLNIRTYDERVREHMLSAVKRICLAECAASDAPKPPEFTTLSRYPLTDNDQRAAQRVMAAFKAEFCR